MSEVDIRARLLDAIENSEVLLIRYSGGTQPGTIREIEPIEFMGADKIVAGCWSSGNDKQYFLSKMEIIDSTDLSLVDYVGPDEDENEDGDGVEEIYGASEIDDLVFEEITPKKKWGFWRVLKWIFIVYVTIIFLYALIPGLISAFQR